MDATVSCAYRCCLTRAPQVDFLKYDNCYSDGSKPEVRYPVMRDALNATGRRIFYAMCEWGVDSPAGWAREVGNSWRTTIDIEDTWLSVLFNLELSAPLWKYAAPGGYNDPDMLELGNGGLTAAEERAHFSLWAALKAPLILGCDLTHASAAVLQIISNPEVIAVNQDAMGAPARRVWSSAGVPPTQPDFYSAVAGAAWAGGTLWRQEPLSLAGAAAMCALGGADCTGFVLESSDADPDVRVPVLLYRGGAPGKQNASAPARHAYVKKVAPPAVADWREVWAGPLVDGAVVAVLFNRAAEPWSIAARWDDMKQLGLCAGVKARVRDLWRRQDLGIASHNYTALVQPHGASDPDHLLACVLRLLSDSTETMQAAALLQAWTVTLVADLASAQTWSCCASRRSLLRPVPPPRLLQSRARTRQLQSCRRTGCGVSPGKRRCAAWHTRDSTAHLIHTTTLCASTTPLLSRPSIIRRPAGRHVIDSISDAPPPPVALRCVQPRCFVAVVRASHDACMPSQRRAVPWRTQAKMAAVL